MNINNNNKNTKASPTNFDKTPVWKLKESQTNSKAHKQEVYNSNNNNEN